MMINKQKLVNHENLPVIAGVEIPTDVAGRFNLNALHRASGLGPNKAPTQWLRTQSAKQLIKELEKETMQNCIVSLEGRNGGTFAHELLAVEYAGWISPAFRLQVNQTFIDYRTGKLVAGNNQLPNFDDPIAAAEAWIEAKNPNALLSGMQSVRLAISANSKAISLMVLLLCSSANNSTV